MTTKPIQFSVIVPCYNEEEVLDTLRSRLLQSLEKMNLSWEVIFVDDGSTDSTYDQLKKISETDARFKIISFSRNFGHQSALMAGLQYTQGNLIGIMDADLQDPPEFFTNCIDKINQGYDVVYAVRRNRKDNIIKRATAYIAYRLIRKISKINIPNDAGDFCVINRRACDELKNLPEYSLYLRGLRSWIGFKQIGIEYDRDARVVGKSKYSLVKLSCLLINALTSFSILPLRLPIYIGILIMSFSLIGVLILTIKQLENIQTVLMFGLIFIGGVQLFTLGFIGEYISKIQDDTRKRPRWIISKKIGIHEIK